MRTEVQAGVVVVWERHVVEKTHKKARNETKD